VETCGILRFLMVFGSPSSPVVGTNFIPVQIIPVGTTDAQGLPGRAR
jgi:hypothetical protein